jgi:DNA-directed RNA polymerase specialized sigma24 family protein
MSRRPARSIPVSWLASHTLDGWENLAVPFFGQRPDEPDDAVEVRDLHEALDDAMAALPPKQREVFCLKALEGRSASEVCDLLGVSPANQRVLLHRARSQVHRRLAVYWPRARRAPGNDADTLGCHGHWRASSVCRWELPAFAWYVFAPAMADTVHLN